MPYYALTPCHADASFAITPCCFRFRHVTLRRAAAADAFRHDIFAAIRCRLCVFTALRWLPLTPLSFFAIMPPPPPFISFAMLMLFFFATLYADTPLIFLIPPRRLLIFFAAIFALFTPPRCLMPLFIFLITLLLAYATR